jgi:signal transduction histidine kinase
VLENAENRAAPSQGPVEVGRTPAVLTLTADGVITSWSLRAEQLLGWSSDQALSVYASSLLGAGGAHPGIGPDDLQEAMRLQSITSPRRLKHRDRGTTETTTTIVAVRDSTGLLGYTVIIWAGQAGPTARESGSGGDQSSESASAEALRQLSESRTLLAAEIADRKQAETSRARLLRRLIVAAEDERRRLARDLHDGLGQRLTALRLILEGRNGPQGQSDQRNGITDALEMLARIDQDVDFIAWELRPAALDELDLTRVLEVYVKEWSRLVRIPAQFRARPGILPRFAPEVEASVYRIAQEGLNNVAKHAHAQSVNVLLELRDEHLALAVEDDGVGLGRVSSSDTRSGITNMRERALAVGGTLELEPTPGGGTTVLACIPLTGVYREAQSTLSEQGGTPDAPLASGDNPELSGDGAGVVAIRKRLQELQRAVGARDEFIATVAHELRNPIAPLTFQVRLALNKTDQLAATGASVSVDWVQTQLRGVERRLHRVLETLDRLLDVSRLSTGRIDLQIEPMNVADVVREVIDACEAELAVARCKLILSDSGHATGEWDRLRVEQVCRNLLSNAIRFGAGRPIEVVVDADRDFASLTVRDHGVGIPIDQQSKIFERFEQGGERRNGGFGIGLWLVRNLCLAMGGAVSVESTPNEGACFTVLLPRRPARECVESASE